ncbi:MAG: 50S ribosomal protein L5 [Patescibacteria group bacterium]
MTKEKQYTETRKLEKIVVNVGVGKLRNLANFDDKVLPAVMEELALITGQKPATRQTKRSIAGFKTREGDIVGLQVTLRRRHMGGFLSKVIHIALPRVKDFRGLELSNVDEHGNLNVGFREQYIFPEVSAEKSKVIFGMQVTLVPREKNRTNAIDFYRSIGIPLKAK